MPFVLFPTNPYKLLIFFDINWYLKTHRIRKTLAKIQNGLRPHIATNAVEMAVQRDLDGNHPSVVKCGNWKTSNRGNVIEQHGESSIEIYWNWVSQPDEMFEVLSEGNLAEKLEVRFLTHSAKNPSRRKLHNNFFTPDARWWWRGRASAAWK